MPSAQDVDFRIVSKAFDSWNVQFRLDVEELLDQRGLLRHLRAIKQRIASMHSLPETSILFDGIVRKTRTDDSVDVIVRIKKAVYEKGRPRVQFREGLASDGTRYAAMSALLDVYYLDQFEKPIMLDRVMQVLHDGSIPEDMIDTGLMVRKVQEVLTNHIPIKGVIVAKGTFPDSGNDAEVEFLFQAFAEPGKTDEYYSSRRVSRGNVVCRKIAATVGRTAGRNVRGEVLPPRRGLDIELKTGGGAELSFDGNEVVADVDGVAVISRTLKRVKMVSGTKEIPESILVKVNPVLRVEGNQRLDIASSQTVEVIGSLTMGSKILTDCEVYVSGDVEEGTLIQAADDITVEGRVRGATLQSETNIIAQKDVADSELTAKDSIIIKGSVRNSVVVGDSVNADTIAGSRIVSRRNVTVQRIDADENNVLSTICVGMYDFFTQRLCENESFLERARENMMRIEMLFGPEIMQQVTASNIQTMLLRFLSKHRLGEDYQVRKQAEAYRRLLESVPPSRSLISQKESENAELMRRIAEHADEGESMIVVREKVAARAVLSVDGIEAEVGALNTAASVRADGEGNLVVTRQTGHEVS